MNAITGKPIGGNQEGKNPSNAYMMSTHVNVATRSHDYGEPKSFKANTAPNVSKLLHIERP